MKIVPRPLFPRARHRYYSTRDNMHTLHENEKMNWLEINDGRLPFLFILTVSYQFSHFQFSNL
jgi:hypothetical protein